MTPLQAVNYLKVGAHLKSDSYQEAIGALERVIVELPLNSIRVRIAVAVGDGEGDAVLLDPEDDDGRIIRELVENIAGPVYATAFIEADIPRIPTIQPQVVKSEGTT